MYSSVMAMHFAQNFLSCTMLMRCKLACISLAALQAGPMPWSISGAHMRRRANAATMHFPSARTHNQRHVDTLRCTRMLAPQHAELRSIDVGRARWSGVHRVHVGREQGINCVLQRHKRRADGIIRCPRRGSGRCGGWQRTYVWAAIQFNNPKGSGSGKVGRWVRATGVRDLTINASNGPIERKADVITGRALCGPMLYVSDGEVHVVRECTGGGVWVRDLAPLPNNSTPAALAVDCTISTLWVALPNASSVVQFHLSTGKSIATLSLGLRSVSNHHTHTHTHSCPRDLVS